MKLCRQCGEVCVFAAEICEDCIEENRKNMEEYERLIAVGHTDHCAYRIISGDGECECGLSPLYLPAKERRKLTLPLCECLRWGRADHSAEEILDNHHNDCPHKIWKKYVKITLIGGNSYIQPIDELHQALDGELDGAEVGSKWTMELIEMPPDRYERLEEFEGH